MIWIVLAALAVAGAMFVYRWRHRGARRIAMPPPPEYEESLQELESLKSGRLWGDFSQPDPHSHD